MRRATESQRHGALKILLCVSAALWLVVAAACGGGSNPTSPSPSPSPNPAPSPTPSPTPTPTPSPGGGTTITITSSGVSPRALTVAIGSRVTFVNNNTISHDMASDPHPEHTQCPELNSVGFLTPGQSRASSNLNTARTCRYHDHNRSGDTSLQGAITIQ